MTAITAIILAVAIVFVALLIGYYLQTGSKTLAEMTKDYYNNEEVQEVVELAKELYDKDLRTITTQEPVKEEEVVFPQDSVLVQQGTAEKKVEEPTPSKKKRKYYPKKPKTQI